MNNYFTVLKAMFRNKLRISSEKSKRSIYAFVALLGVVYVAVMFALISLIVELKEILSYPPITASVYFFMLLTAGLIVLVFGIISLVTTLFLAKDTDFYSMLPVKSSVVFAAKFSYVYIAETVIVSAILLPLIIAFGIVVKAWAWFYVISILMLAIVPAFPLTVAAIFAVPVMFIASKLKNRSIVALVFYIVLFGGFFGLYFAFIFMTTDITVTEETINSIANGIQAVHYIFYPYSVLSDGVVGVTAFGLGVGASVAVNVVIFVGISLGVFAILLLLGKFMYAQASKANNQTDNSKAKKGEFKSGGGFGALIKREYLSSLRTTQVAFQCYAVLLLPIIFAFVMSVPYKNMSPVLDETGGMLSGGGMQIIAFSTLAAMLATVGNAAATTFSREGSAVASLKILPVGINKIVKAKITTWLIVALPVTAISVAVVNIFIFDLTSMLLSVFALIPLAAMFVIFGALWDLKEPKLKWTDPSQAVKHNGHTTAGQFICMAGGLLSVVLYMVMSMNYVDFAIAKAVCWSLIYATLVIFAIVNIYLYRNINKYYNRIEI